MERNAAHRGAVREKKQLMDCCVAEGDCNRLKKGLIDGGVPN